MLEILKENLLSDCQNKIKQKEHKENLIWYFKNKMTLYEHIY